jgi:hypothetical protein
VGEAGGVSDHRVDGVPFLQDEIWAVLAVVEDVVGGDVEEVVDGGGDVGGGVAAGGGVGALAVGGADDLADLGAAAGEEDRAGGAPVVAAAVFVDFGGTAELGEEDDERVVEEAALVEVVDEGGEGAVDAGDVVGAFGHVADVGEVLDGDVVVVPQVAVQAVVTVVDHHETGAGFDEAAGHEAAAADFGAAVGGARVFGFLREIERGADVLRAEQAEGVIVVAVDDVGAGMVFEAAERVIDRAAQFGATAEAGAVESVEQIERLGAQVVFDVGVRVPFFTAGGGEIHDFGATADAERGVLFTQPAADEHVVGGRAGARPTVGGDVAGKQVARAVQVADDRTDVRLGLDLAHRHLAAGECVRLAHQVVVAVVREAADDGQLMRNFREFGARLGELHAGKSGGDRREGAADFFGGFGLGIERIDVGDAATHPEEDDAACLAVLREGRFSERGPGDLRLKQVGHRRSDGEGADFEHRSPAGGDQPGKGSGELVGCGVFACHLAVSVRNVGYLSIRMSSTDHQRQFI